MDDILLLILGTIVALFASGVFSGTEMGVYALNRVKLRVSADGGDWSARRLLPFVDRQERLVITALVGTNIADYSASVCVTALLLRCVSDASYAEIYATAILTPLILVFGNIVPKERFRRQSNRLMKMVSLPLVVCVFIVRMTGLMGALSWLSQAVLRWVSPDRDSERETLPRVRMLQMLREGAERGGLTSFQRDAFDRVVRLSRLRVARVMIPRARAAMIPEDISREDVLRIARMAHFSRLPVYRKDPRHVVGVLNVFDVLTDEEERPVNEYVRDIVRLRVSDSVPRALRRLQRSHEVMAVVCNRRGDCLGLLTVKDLVEEIVGDIEVW